MRLLVAVLILLSVGLSPGAAASTPALPCATNIACAQMESESSGAGSCDDPWPHREERRDVTLSAAGGALRLGVSASCYGSNHAPHGGARGSDLVVTANATSDASMRFGWHDDASWGDAYGASRVCEYAYEARAPVPDPMAPARGLRVTGGGPCVAGVGWPF